MFLWLPAYPAWESDFFPPWTVFRIRKSCLHFVLLAIDAPDFENPSVAQWAIRSV